MHEKLQAHSFTFKILIGMLVGIVVGLLWRWLPISDELQRFVVVNIFQLGGNLFINLIRMVVVPIVFVSLVCGGASLGSLNRFGRIGGKIIALYLITTVIAIILALFFASLTKIGQGMNLIASTPVELVKHPSFREIILKIIPINPFAAFSEGMMLQVIVFALLFSFALSSLGETGKKCLELFQIINEALMKLITMIMKTAPYGVFFLLATLTATTGAGVFSGLIKYFVLVAVVLLIQFFVVYSLMLYGLSGLNPMLFFKKLRAALLFAFSISSSNAVIPVMLKTVEKRLGVDNSVASFAIPLGSTVNMDGTAIMQGIATVFIANAYGLHLGIAGYLMVIVMATLSSIGTAGVPSVGLITLTMVLTQVGLPAQGVALIIGVDRLLDMLRTSVNVCGDAMIACVVAKSENRFDSTIFHSTDQGEL